MAPHNLALSRRSFFASSAAGVASLSAASAIAAANNSAKLQAGTAVVDTTPKADVPLRGPIAGSGFSNVVHDRLHARAIALKSGDERLAFCVCDITMMEDKIINKARRLVQQKIGLAPERIIISATHTHRAPRAVELDLGEAHDRYRDRLASEIANAVCQAFGRLEPARIGWGAADLAKHCKNRRWLMKPGAAGLNPFGENTDRARMYGGPGKDSIRQLGPIDPQLSILSIRRADKTPLALFANYNIHYGVGGAGVSADYFGCFSRRINELLGSESSPVLGIMSNGNSGDIGAGGKPEPLASSIAAAAVEIYQTIEHRDIAPIAVKSSTLDLGVRRPDKDRVKWARQVMAGTWNKPAHRWKKIYAQHVLWLSKYPEFTPVEMHAVRIGDLGVVSTPCEVYAETGLAIKQQSPLKATFTIGIANGYHGYLPPPSHHKLGGYTTWPAISSCLEVQAEPKIRQRLLQHLQELA